MKSTEELLTRIMNHLAENFRDRIILKGGMLLRLYNSPRNTQDVDFVLVTKESRKKWKEKIETALNNLPGVQVNSIELNSRGIFIDMEDGDGHQAMIEINVASTTHLPPEPLSTALLSQQYSLSGRIISSMAIPEAFSHKIAAVLERNAVRDLYDLSQMEAMGGFDVNTLKARLSNISLLRAKPKAVSPSRAAALLRLKLAQLDQLKIEKELYPSLPPEFRPGVLGLIRASVGRLIQRLEQLAD